MSRRNRSIRSTGLHSLFFAIVLGVTASSALIGQEPAAGDERIVELQRALSALPAHAPPADRAEAHNALGLQFWARSRFDSAMVHLQLARSLWSEGADSSGLARAFNNIGVTLYQSGHLEPALNSFQRSLELRRHVGDTRGAALVLSNIGNTLRDLGLYERALPVLNAAVATADTVALPHIQAYALHTLGLLHAAMGSHADARQALESSIEKYRVSDGDSLRHDAASGWALNAVHLGLVYVLQGDVRGGVAMLEAVRAVAHAENHPRREATALLQLGKAARLQGDLARATDYLEDALRIANAGEQRSIAMDVLAELADVYQARGATGLALARLRSHQALRDTVVSQHALQRIAAAEALDALTRQELENQRLRDDQRVQEAVIERQRLAGALGAGLLIMALALVGVLVRFNRTGRERERLLSEANTALAAANQELRVALSEVRTLKGLIPICASCKKVRHDEGYWEAVETYISHRSDALFSHSICSDCGPEIYGADWRVEETEAAASDD